MTVTLVTEDRYRRITGDLTLSVDLQEALQDAIDLLEEVLDRPLEQAPRTERMYPNRDGMLSPRAVPIVSAVGLTVYGDQLFGALPYAAFDIITGYQGTQGVDVTYTGGWVERSANPTDPHRLPACIEEDLCFAAMAIACPGAAQAFQVPAGVTSARLGDAALTWGATGAPLTRRGVRWSPRTLRYRYRGGGTGQR